MDWEFWRIDWPAAAVAFALAILPVWVIVTHWTEISARLSIELASEPQADAVAMV